MENWFDVRVGALALVIAGCAAARSDLEALAVDRALPLKE